MRDKSEEPSNRIHKLKYKAIGFDTDDTLYDFQCAMRRSLGFTLDRILERMPDCDLTVDKMIGIRNQVAEEMKGKARDFEEIRLKAFERTPARAHVKKGPPSHKLLVFTHFPRNSITPTLKNTPQEKEIAPCLQ